MKKIRFWAIGLCLLLLLSSIGILAVTADELMLEGICGDNVRWILNTTTGELTITGEGAISHYSPTQFPMWLSLADRITSVIVEEGVTELGTYTFVYCSRLTSVTLPNSLTTVGEGAFSGCQSLTEVILPEGVTTVGSNALKGCTALTTVVLPSTLTALGDHAFADSSLETVIYKGDAEAWAAVSAGADNEILTDTLVFHTEHVFDREITAPRYLAAEADCHESALYYKSCVCGEIHTETFPWGEPAGHRGGEATCMEQAVCTYCGELYGDLADHTPGAAATCTEDQLCAVCDEVLTEKLGHDYRDTVTPPTCVDDGFTTHTCARCADEYADTPVEALGHTEGTEATCTEDQLCTVCGEILAEKLGHDYRDTVTPPTCVDDGFTTHTCARCADEYTDTPVEALGHTEGTEATCTEDQLCTVCGEILAEKLGHDYRDTVTPPTCVDDGFTTHTCARCADEYTDTPVEALGHTEGTAATCTEDQICTVCDTVLAEKLGHSYVDKITLAPTCTENGEITYTCTVCAHVSLEEIAPLGHTEGSAATCTEDQLCTVCNTVLAEKLGHSYTDTVVEPTCTEQGYTSHACGTCLTVYHDAFVSAKGHTEGPAATCTEDQLCVDCGALLAAKTGHSYAETVVEPTCTAQGYTLHSCEVCGDAYRDTFITAKGHTEGPAATCTENQICTVCQTVLTPAPGHETTDTVVAPTCNLPGYTQHTCARCQTTYRDTVTPPTGHTPGTAPTCTDAQTCTACGEILTQKLGHDYRSTVVASTCTTPGYISHECALCHAAYRDSYTAAMGHNPGVPATCTAPQLCTVCNHVISPATGHDYTDTVTPPTCTDGGYTIHDCKVCDHVYVGESTDALGHTAGPEATCAAPQLCTVCYALLAEKLGHTMEDTVVAPTCEEDGHTVHACSVCGYTLLSDFTPATGHTVGDWVIVRHPDVGVSGRKHKTCEHCDVILEAETFWPTQETVPTEPDVTQDQNIAAPDGEESGCQLTGGNIAVIVIVLVAAFLLWFVDMRRR